MTRGDVAYGIAACVLVYVLGCLILRIPGFGL